MKSVIDAVMGILMLIGLGTGLGSLHKAVKTETVKKVHKGYPRWNSTLRN